MFALLAVALVLGVGAPASGAASADTCTNHTPTPFQDYTKPTLVHNASAQYRIPLPIQQPRWSVAIDRIATHAYHPDVSCSYSNGVVSTVSHASQQFTHDAQPGAVAVSGGAVYAIAQHHLVKLSLDSGHQMWQSSVSVSAPVVIAPAIVLAQSGTSVAAFSQSSGALEWKTPNDPENTFAASGGVLFTRHFVEKKVSKNGQSWIYDNWFVSARDAQTGAMRWTAKLDNALSGLPFVAGGFAFLTDLEGEPGIDTTHAFDVRTGKQVWDGPSSPVIVSGPVGYFSDSQGLFLLDWQLNAIVYQIDVRRGKALAEFHYGPEFAKHDVSEFSTASDLLIRDKYLFMSASGVIFRYVLDKKPEDPAPPAIVCLARLIAGPNAGRFLFAPKHGLIAVAWTDQKSVYCDDDTRAYDVAPDPFMDYAAIRGHVAHVDVVGNIAYVAEDDGTWSSLDLTSGTVTLRAQLDSSPYVTTFVQGQHAIAVTATHVYAF